MSSVVVHLVMMLSTDWLSLQKCEEIRTYSFCPPRTKYVLHDSHILKGHDLFRSNKGLSGRPYEIYCKLNRDWLSVAEIAGVTGLPKHSVRPALKTLVAFGFAEVDKGSGPKGGDMYRCVDTSEDCLDPLAREMGVFDDMEIRRERESANQRRSRWVEYLLMEVVW